MRLRHVEGLAQELTNAASETSDRVHVADLLGSSALAGGCYVSISSLRGRQYEPGQHLGQWSRDAWEFHAAAEALSQALLVDPRRVVKDAAIAGIRRLNPLGHHTVKHALVSALAVEAQSGDSHLASAIADALVQVVDHRDLEIITRLSLMLETGLVNHKDWTDGLYHQLYARYPPRCPTCGPLFEIRCLEHMFCVLLSCNDSARRQVSGAERGDAHGHDTATPQRRPASSDAHTA